MLAHLKARFLRSILALLNGQAHHGRADRQRQSSYPRASLLLVELETRIVPSTIIDLGTLGGTNSAAFGINESGQVVGYAETISGEEDAFLYTSGTMKDLGTLGGTFSDANGINDADQVVGFSQKTPLARMEMAFSVHPWHHDGSGVHAGRVWQ